MFVVYEHWGFNWENDMAWDSTLRIIEKKSEQEIAHIVMTKFQCGDTKDSIKYTLGGLYVRPTVSYVSKDAIRLIMAKNPAVVEKGAGVCYRKLKVEAVGVTREHIIPVSELYEHFKELFENSKLTERYILKFMKKLHIAVISDEENNAFSKAHLTRKMPEGWWSTKDLDPLARYRAAGLDDSIWAKFN